MKFKRLFGPYSAFALCLTANIPTTICAQQFTWDGGGANTDWSTLENWVGDPAAIDFPPTGISLIFDGTAGTSNTNDAWVTSLVSGGGTTALTFNTSSFILEGDPIIFESDASGDVVRNPSGLDQTINIDLTSGGGAGQRTRNISPNGATITFNGDLDCANDSWFPNDTAGTIVFNGNNSGVGVGLFVGPGDINARRTIRTNVANTHLVFGSPTAIGSPNGTDGHEDIVLQNASGSLYMSANTDLTGANMLNNTLLVVSNSGGERMRFEGTNDMEFGGIINSGNSGHGWILQPDSTCSVEVSGPIYISSNANPSRILIGAEGSGSFTLSGVIHDTYDPGQIVTPGTFSESTLRKDSAGLLIVSGDNLFNGLTQVNGGTLRVGHPNALGPETRATSFARVIDVAVGDPVAFLGDTSNLAVGMAVIAAGIPAGTVIAEIDPGVSITLDMAPTVTDLALDATFDGGTTANGIDLNSAGTLDLNGISLSKIFLDIGGTIINSNTSTPAELTTEIVNLGNSTFDGPGDITASNIRHTGGISRRITKNGTGTLTLGGDLSNSRYGLTVNEGNIILAKTAGEAVARFPLIMNNAASTVTLTNIGEQIGNQTDANGLHQINEGTLDLNGLDESLGALSTSNGTEPGGIVTNSNTGTASTFTLLGASADAAWPGTVSGNLNLVKNGAVNQTLTGTLAYTGDTTINDGLLILGATSDLDDNSAVRINGAGGLDIAAGVTDVVDQYWLDGVQQPAGTYGSVGSGATNEDDFFFPGDGILSVTSDPVAGSDYDTWAASFGLTGGPTDDDDNDGVSNEEEYAFGLNPSDSGSLNAISTILERDTGTFSYTRRDPVDSNLTYTVFTSTTLEEADWTLDATATQIAGATDGDGNQTVDVTLSTTPTVPKLFVRVEAN